MPDQPIPPLDAGASDTLPDLDPAPTPDLEPVVPDPAPADPPAPEPDPEPVKPEEGAPEPEPKGDDIDHDILSAFSDDGTEQPPVAPDAVPQGISPEDWAAYQKFKAAQAAPPATPEPKPLAESDITDEDFNNAFDNPDAFRGALSKAANSAAARVRDELGARLAKVAEGLYNDMASHMEQMFYIMEASKETPEIFQYQKAFKAAYAKTYANAKEGDLKTPVDEAVKLFKKTFTQFQAIKSNKKVDVRPKQTAPKGAGGSSNRELHKTEKQPEDGNLGFLASLYKE